MADDQPENRTNETMRVDVGLVRELAELLATNDLTEIEVEDGGRKIKVRREATFSARTQVVQAAVQPVPAAPLSPAAPPEVAAAPAGETVKSPMVGTAFLSDKPGSKPFVEPGDSVKAGDTLLIVEAMKVMNPILAPKPGTVRQVLVADAQPVEFDQPLVVIE